MSNDWFRSWHGAPTDPKWRTIAKKADVPTSLVVAFLWALMDRASQADDRGSFVGVDLEVMADYLDCDEMQLRRIVTQCDARNVTCDGRLVAWEKRQPKRENDNSAERTKLYRERKKKQTTYEDVTQCDAVRRNVTLDKIREDKSTTTNVVVSASGKPKRENPKTKIPEDAQPTDKDRAAAISAGLTDSDFRSQWQKFRDYHLSRGNLMADWQAAWRTWLGNVRQYQRPPPKAFSTEKTDWAARALLDIEAKMEIQNGQHPQNTTSFEALEFLSIDSKSSC